MKHYKITALILSVLICLTMCSCSEKSEKKEIAVIVKATDSDFWHRVKGGVMAAATEYNVDVTFEGPENEEDSDAQISLINRAVKNGVGAVVLSAIDFEKSAEAVNAAARAGVKIVAIDSAVNSKNVSAFIGTDNKEAGKAAAKAAIDGSGLHDNIKIGIVNYYESTENGRSRYEGFKEYIEGVPNAEIAAEITADSNTESACKAAQDLLKAYPDVNVLVGFNEWMTLGIGEAVKSLADERNIYTVGFDTNTVSVGMLETGEMDTLIVQNPFAIGYLGVKSASALISGEGCDSEHYTAVTAVTRKNMFDSDIQKLLFNFTE